MENESDTFEIVRVNGKMNEMRMTLKEIEGMKKWKRVRVKESAHLKNQREIAGLMNVIHPEVRQQISAFFNTHLHFANVTVIRFACQILHNFEDRGREWESSRLAFSGRTSQKMGPSSATR
jgi:hypothetical protein